MRTAGLRKPSFSKESPLGFTDWPYLLAITQADLRNLPTATPWANRFQPAQCQQPPGDGRTTRPSAFLIGFPFVSCTLNRRYYPSLARPPTADCASPPKAVSRLSSA